LAPVISGFRNLRIPVPPPAAKQKDTGLWKRQNMNGLKVPME
jgi:hypothetical protein